MKKYYFIIILLLIISCTTKTPKEKARKFAKIADGNIFTDNIIKQIYTLKYERNAKKIIKNLKDKFASTPDYKKKAILALGEIQDETIIDKLAEYLDDKDEEVRIYTAFALGQIKSSNAEYSLIKHYKTEKSLLVKKEILEAIGKCGTETGLNFITTINTNENTILKAKIIGLAKFAERKIENQKTLNYIFSLIENKTTTENTKYWCSYYLYRSSQDLATYSKALIKSFDLVSYIYSKDNIVKATRKIKNQDILFFLKSIILNKSLDYKIRVSAIRSISGFDYHEVEKIMFTLLNNTNYHISTTASEYFVKNGKKFDSEKYYKNAKLYDNSKIRTNLLTAAIKFADKKDNISTAIISGFEASDDEYEKASLLEALAYDISKYEFVSKHTFTTDYKVISTAGISALTKMRYSKKFDEYKKELKKKNGTNLEIEFAEIFKKAIMSGDIAMMNITAKILREPKFKFKKIYVNTYFIKQALNKCILPRDIEAYTELQKTNEYINGDFGKSAPAIFKYKKPDWNFISSIPPEQKVRFVSNRGNFTIQLDVNHSPISVYTFLELTNENFYNGLSIHRVVSDFIIQSGCPQGDGWGSPGFAIRSEISFLKFDEGAVGLASSGKDTEASQWFVTTTKTPHLDGNYTIIGYIVDGLDVIHKLRVGDKILTTEIL